MTEFKGTKGEWSISRISGIATGIGISKKINGGIYTEMICDFILPNTDEEYEKSNIESDAQLMVSAPDLLEALQNLLELKKIKDEQGKTDLYMQNQPKAWDKAQKAIDKALNGE